MSAGSDAAGDATAASGGPAGPGMPVAGQPSTSGACAPGTSAPGACAPGASARAPRLPAADPTTLLLVRHGRTPMTEAGRFSGSGGQDPALSAAGEQDAARVADVVFRLGVPGALLADIGRPTAVVCSPMQRTRQTASAVASRLGLPVQTDEAWIEAAFGVWEGLTYGEIVRRFPAQVEAWQGSTTYAPTGGESLDHLVERVGSARRRVLRTHRGQVVVVVTHATPVRAVLQNALDAGPAALWRLRVSPASLSVVRYWEDDHAEAVTVNSTAHLAG